MKVVCWLIGSGGVWLRLSPAEFLRRERAGEVYGVGAAAYRAIRSGL